MVDMSRRSSIKYLAAGIGIMVIGTHFNAYSSRKRIRLGGPILQKWQDPEEWAQWHQKLGYAAALCPVAFSDPSDLVQEYMRVAQRFDITIAEVGAWSNPLSSDPSTRTTAIEKCQQQLDLADRMGACCCVNISGSRGSQWDGPHSLNLTEETFDLIVETMRTIIDRVKPKRTFFTLETMPWAFPDSADAYLRLLNAIDRKQFAVHLDPVNLICSPQRYYANGQVIKECFAKLGAHIKSCHAKDIILGPEWVTHLQEVRPGLGGLDYPVYLRELSRLTEAPLILEHLKTEAEYAQAADFIRSTAAQLQIAIS